LLRDLADEGRTVLLSSHLLAEVSVTADHLVVVQKGRLVADCPTEQLLSDDAISVVVVAPERDRLRDVLADAGAVVEVRDVDTVVVSGLPSARIGEIALRSRLVLHELTPQHASLEDAFLELTESFGRTI
jgi:ABC-2 type transport system ATP-binding protein